MISGILAMIAAIIATRVPNMTMIATDVTSIGGDQATIIARYRDIGRPSPRRSVPMSG
ncbi:MAG TPA: hypothetical protein VGY54_01340 [Polyangiaceae bacterium]|jgi:hypothetical protein|nr:hypothetical protein [Polyangiaceae bacterium]